MPLHPQQMTRCLKRMSSMTKQEVQREYGFPHLATAAALRRRAHDMVTHGFEWTLQNGWPHNPIPLRYEWGAPCCKMSGQQETPETWAKYECVEWDRGNTELPLGEPYFGGPWPYKIKDTGSYALGAARLDHKWPEGWVTGAWLGDDDEGLDPGYAPPVQANMYNR